MELVKLTGIPPNWGAGCGGGGFEGAGGGGAEDGYYDGGGRTTFSANCPLNNLVLSHDQNEL